MLGVLAPLCVLTRLERQQRRDLQQQGRERQLGQQPPLLPLSLGLKQVYFCSMLLWFVLIVST